MRKILSLVFLWLLSVASAAESVGAETTTDWTGYALVTASPEAVRSAVGESVEQNIQSPFAGIFDVRLNAIEVIYGNFEKRAVDVKLAASHREVLLKKRRIYVLLKISDDAVSAVSWGIPSKIVCFPAEMIVDKKMAGDFMFSDARNGRLCTNAEWYR